MVSMRFPRAVERNVEVRFQGRVQKQTYSENDYLLCYYGCLQETRHLYIYSFASASNFREHIHKSDIGPGVRKQEKPQGARVLGMWMERRES